MNEFPERRETYLPPNIEIIAENELFIFYRCRGVRTLQDKVKDMYSRFSSDFQYRMMLDLMKRIGDKYESEGILF